MYKGSPVEPDIWRVSACVAANPHACTGNKFGFMDTFREISCVQQTDMCVY